MRFFCITFLLLASLTAFGQQKTDKETEEKQLRESIDKMIDNYTSNLKLEDWQVFYVDSILTNDYGLMVAELQKLQEAKVSNSTQYIKTQDKWQEQMYNSFHKILNDEQWKKYLKLGAAREKKARDKRSAGKF